jgi:hypothetical protein
MAFVERTSNRLRPLVTNVDEARGRAHNFMYVGGRGDAFRARRSAGRGKSISEVPMRRFALAFAAAALVAAVAAAPAYARGGGGGHGGGGGWHGGGGGGGWHGGGGGGWHGGGGGWHGGGSHWHGSVGVVVGPGWGWGWGWPYYGYGWPYYGYAYGYPYYGYSASYPAYAPAYAPSSAYVEKTPATSYWYYCTDPAGYYPYVQTCSKSWMQVVPQSSPDASSVPPDAAGAPQ